MNPVAKTNAVRILDSMGVPYTLHAYDVDEEHLDAIHVADRLGVPADCVFKTLVMRNDRGEILVFCVPGNGTVNLKKAARASGSGKVEAVHMKELFEITGYVRGGCSPIAMKRKYPLYVDEMALVYDAIFVSGGSRGIQIRISPSDLVRICGGTFADIAV